MADESSFQGTELKEDDELDELLDSALEDFDKTTPSTAKQSSQADSQNGANLSDCTKRTETKACEKSSDTTTVKTQGSTTVAASPQDTLDRAHLEANLGQVPGLDQLENAMKTMLGNEPELLAHLEQFAQAAASADHDSPSSLANLEANLARTMNHLAQNAKDLENCPTAPLNEDFFKAMSDMNLASGSDGELDFLPLMQGMMQNLLSKDVLYPALKDLKEKYPVWLGENGASLPSDELDRYRKQYDLVCEVCSEYDAETSVDSDEVKKKRFEKLLSLMQQMQECGQPPADLVGEMPPGFTAPIPEMPEAPQLPDELRNECKVT